MRRSLIHFGVQLLLLLILPVTFTGCAAAPAETPTPTSIVTVVKEGVVTEHTASDFTLLTNIGRLVLKFDKNTISHSIDLNSQQPVTGPVNANAFYLGEEVQVEYNPANNLVLTIVFTPSEKTSYADLITGTVTEVNPSYLNLSTIYVGLPRTLRISYSNKIVIIKKDGSLGSVDDLHADMNIRAFCGGSFTAYLIEIQ